MYELFFHYIFNIDSQRVIFKICSSYMFTYVYVYIYMYTLNNKCLQTYLGIFVSNIPKLFSIIINYYVTSHLSISIQNYYFLIYTLMVYDTFRQSLSINLEINIIKFIILLKHSFFFIYKIYLLVLVINKIALLNLTKLFKSCK